MFQKRFRIGMGAIAPSFGEIDYNILVIGTINNEC